MEDINTCWFGLASTRGRCCRGSAGAVGLPLDTPQDDERVGGGSSFLQVCTAGRRARIWIWSRRFSRPQLRNSRWAAQCCPDVSDGLLVAVAEMAVAGLRLLSVPRDAGKAAGQRWCSRGGECSGALVCAVKRRCSKRESGPELGGFRLMPNCSCWRSERARRMIDAWPCPPTGVAAAFGAAGPRAQWLSNHEDLSCCDLQCLEQSGGAPDRMEEACIGSGVRPAGLQPLLACSTAARKLVAVFEGDGSPAHGHGLGQPGV